MLFALCMLNQENCIHNKRQVLPILLLAKKKSAEYAHLQAYIYTATAYQHGQHGCFVRRQKGLEVTAAGQRD